MKRGSKPMPVKRRSESVLDVAQELELLCVKEEVTDMGRAKELCEKRVAELRKSNGTLEMGYQWILKDLEDTQNQLRILKQYYFKVKKIQQQTNLITPEGNQVFEAGAERRLADLEREKCTVFIAGETSAGRNSLINLLLGEKLLPSNIQKETMTTCEISHGSEKEIVLHFSNKSEHKRILKGGNIEDQIKEYIQKSIEDEDWCKKIEIMLPNTLLEGGIVIVNSPGIGESDHVKSIFMDNLSQANAFIYVINSPQAGGLQEDLLRVLDEWKKLYEGREEPGITAESALFVCNKWDAMEGKDDETETEELQKNIIRRLRERIPKLDEECQVVRISMNTAKEELMETGKMNDDLYTLICAIQDLLHHDVKMKATFFYLWISGQISWLKDLANVQIQNTQRSRNECLEVREELNDLLQKLEKGSHIHEIDDAIHFHEEELCKELTSYLRSEEVQKKFCDWSEKDLPVIGHRHSSRRIKFELGKCIDRRLHSLLKSVENREKHFAKARADLEEKRLRYFSDLQKGICDIDRVLDSEDQSVPFELHSGRMCLPFYARMKKMIVAAGVVFMPVLIPVGLAAGALFAPAFGYMAVAKYLKEHQLRDDPCKALKELSPQFLKSFIKESLRDHVQRELANEKNQISQIKRCHSAIISKYDQQCEAFRRIADESGDEEALEEKALEERAMVDLYWELRNMRNNLLFDAIQNGVPVMYPSGQIDGKKLSCNMEEVLGVGSSAKVFKGTLKGQSVAVKRLQQELRPQSVARFLEEAGMLRQVQHKNILTFHGVCMNVQNGRLISLDIVLELCASSLKDQIVNKKRNTPWMTEDAAVKILRCTLYILLGLEFLHDLGIVHRDIKLSNMLISKDKVIKIADFGWAKSESSITGTQCGTLFYMAPEVRKRIPYGSKVDMYSFGIMMWEMWYGKEIFADLIENDEEIPPPTEVRSYLSRGPVGDGSFAPPAEWTNLMISCCNPDPDQRPTATECKELLVKITRKYEK